MATKTYSLVVALLAFICAVSSYAYDSSSTDGVYKIYYGCDEDAPSTFTDQTAYIELDANGSTSKEVKGGNKCIWLAVPSDVFHVDGIYNSTAINNNILNQFQLTTKLSQYQYVQYNGTNYIVYAKRDANAFQVSQYFKFNIVSGKTTYYTITFKDYDGTLLYTYTYQYGLDPIIPNRPYREGYTFDRWNPSLTTVTQDQEYKATYKENSSAITTPTASAKTSTYVYDINGQRISSAKKGMNIIDGKKVMIKK